MINKITNVIFEQTINVPGLLFKNYRSLNISELELVVLIYLINYKNDLQKMSEDMNFSLKEIMNIIASLSDKGIVSIDVIDNGVKEEIINLEPLYNKVGLLVVNKEEKTNTTIYDKFEQEFGRTLSPMEYEIIGAWLESFDEKFIIMGLKEATYNGVSNLRYIDKILHEWQKKNLKTEKDIIENKKSFKKNSNKELFDYDWLNEKNN